MALIRRGVTPGTTRRQVPRKAASPSAPKVVPVGKISPPKAKAPKVEQALKISIENQYGCDYTGIGMRGENEFTFNVRLGGTPFCCGLQEVGEFSVDQDYDDYDSSLEFTKADRVAIVKATLERIYEDNTHGKRCVTLIFTTIENDSACDLVVEAVADGKLFKPTKEFVNSNSHNKNVLYVSTN